MGKKQFSTKLLTSPSTLRNARVLKPSDLLTWDLTKVAQILTAQARGEIRASASSGGTTEDSLRRIRTKGELSRKFSNAKLVYNKWLESTDILTMALGSARYIVECAEKTSSSHLGRLFAKALEVIQHHTHECPDHCVDLIHNGVVVPDDNVNLLYALDGSMSNFARVTITNPAPLYNALSDDYAGPSAFGEMTSSVTSGESGCLSQHSSNWTPLMNIYSLPQFIAQDESRIIDDMLVDQCMLGNPEMFGVERVKWLSTQTKDRCLSLSFTRVFQHWCVQEHISHHSITRFLKLLHFYKPTITIGDYSPHGSIPHTGRTLLSISKKAKRAKGRGGEKNTENLFIEHNCEVRSIFGPDLKTRDTVEVGRYVHFGLEKALLGTSIGLIHRYHYRNLLRRIHTVHPGLLPRSFLDLTKPESDEPFSKNAWWIWLTHRERIVEKQEPIVFEVRINADGAQWFESSYIKGTPILGKLVAIRTVSGGLRVKIPYNLGKPFVIGVFEHTRGKPPASELLKDTIREMDLLHPRTLEEGEAREGASFAVQVTCFNCDAPMRSDLKGTKSCNGFYGCERCLTRGVYVKRTKKRATKTKRVIRKETVPDGDNTSGEKSTKWVCHRITKNGKGTKRPLEQANQVGDPDATEEPTIKRKRNLPNRDVESVKNTEYETHDGDASDEDEAPEVGHDAIPNSVQMQLRSATAKKTKKGGQGERSGAVQLRQRHSLAVISKRKQRKKDETSHSTDEEEDATGDQTEEDTSQSTDEEDATEVENAIATEKESNERSAEGGNKEDADGRKLHGGSTYFPEIGAEKRTDEDWEDYRWPEEAGVVSTILLFTLSGDAPNVCCHVPLIPVPMVNVFFIYVSKFWKM